MGASSSRLLMLFRNRNDIDFQRLRRHFDNANIQYQENAARRSLSTVFSARNGYYAAVVSVCSQERLHVVVHLPTAVPLGCRPDIREAMLLLNRRIAVGSFEMADERLYMYGYSLFTRRLDDQLIHRLLTTCLLLTDEFSPAFQSVIFANATPAEAVDRALSQLQNLDLLAKRFHLSFRIRV